MNGRSRVGNRGRGRVKRQEVESEDGWTVVTHGVSKMSMSGGEDRVGAKKAGQLPESIVEGMTVEKLVGELKKLKDQWTDTAVANQFVSLLEKNHDLNVTEAVCIGVGSFSRDWEHRHRSMWQVVLFLDVVRLLRTRNAQMKLYAQDPAFTHLDKDFLQHLDVEVTDHDIEKHISATSFVFSPFVDWFLLLPAFLKDKKPSLYVGNEILDDYTAFAGSEEKREKLTECNELGRAFLKDTDCVRLKDFDKHANALNGMVVYIRRREDQEDDPA